MTCNHPICYDVNVDHSITKFIAKQVLYKNYIILKQNSTLEHWHRWKSTTLFAKLLVILFHDHITMEERNRTKETPR